MKSKFLRNTLAAVFTGVFAAGASATTFNFTQNAGFLVDSNLVSTAGGQTGLGWFNSGWVPEAPVGEFNTLVWGNPLNNAAGHELTAAELALNPWNPVMSTNWANNFSGLRVEGQTGTVSTGAMKGVFGGWEIISTSYHQNHTLWSNLPGTNTPSGTLLSGQLFSLLTIGSHVDPDGIPFTFNETLNTTLITNCPGGGNSTGSAIPCDDIFTFDASGFFPLVFSEGGKWYEVEFGLDNFVGSWTDFPACMGINAVCTVKTSEGVTSSFDVLMRIREIPEPSTIALLGAALLGLGLRRRKV